LSGQSIVAIDKNKIIEAATKFVQKGQYDKAIKEYQKLLGADLKDARVQQKLGELYQKKGDNALAADCFLKVAEIHSADGFFLKAVAVYKQVLKLNPALVDVNLKLAELHQQLGLMSDAMAQYQLVANHYDKTGNTRASLDTLRKMVDLDPDNIASRIKLAELYAREQMNLEAIEEFRRAADYLKRNNRVEDYIKVAERLVFLDPGDLALTRELAGIYLAKQDTKRSLAKLQLCFKADPKDIETLTMLAQAFKDLGQVSKTVSVFKELAKIYDEQDRADEERAAWRKVLELAPDDREAHAKLDPPPTAASRASLIAAPEAAAPPPVSPPPPTPAPAAPVRPSHDQIVKLLTETDVYVKYGLHDKAIEHIKKVFAADPNSIDAHEKAAVLYGLTGNPSSAAESLARAVRLCMGRHDVDRARANVQRLCEREPNHPDVPEFLEAVGGLGPAEEVAEIEDDAIMVVPADEEAAAPDPEASSAGQEHELIAVAAGADEALDELPPEDDLAIHAAVELDDGAITYAVEDSDLVEQPAELVESGDPTLELAAEDQDLEPAVAEPLGAGGAEPAMDGEPLEAEGAAQSVAHRTLRGPGAQPPAPELERQPPPVTSPGLPAFDPPDEPASDELDEVAFFLSQGALDEAWEILETVRLAYPDSVRARQLAQQLEERERAQNTSVDEVGAPAPPQAANEAWPRAETPTDETFDLASELAKEDYADLGTGGAPQEDFQYSVRDVFEEFKKGVQKVVKAEDVDTHYDLGIAYKEMGLIDDAIGEFEQARASAAGRPKEVDCLTMIGMCQTSRLDWAQAVDAFKGALASAQTTAEQAKALRFEIGLALEGQGKVEEALRHFQTVAQADPTFRDVGGAIERLRHKATQLGQGEPAAARAVAGVNRPNGARGNGSPAPSGEPSPKGPIDPTAKKARKVGYV
jgi:pilus assembly protein FimV